MPLLDTVISASVAVLGVLTVFATLLWFIMKLVVNPLRDDIDELKELIAKIKPTEDIQTLIDLSIAQHHDSCLRRAQQEHRDH